jgi:acyl carrier protein phosphodiesterase
MNYLAHAYLSFNNPEILTGNMISDFIKGKKQYLYPKKIHTGIKLHRAIDTFTDSHPATRAIKAFFKEDYGLYSGAFTDIVYDYFLANDKTHFESEHARLIFTRDTYSSLEPFMHLFPEKFALMFPFMKEQNWLFHYASEEGIGNSFKGLSRRAVAIRSTEKAFAIFGEKKGLIQKHYDEFFPELFIHTKQKLAELSNS